MSDPHVSSQTKWQDALNKTEQTECCKLLEYLSTITLPHTMVKAMSVPIDIMSAKSSKLNRNAINAATEPVIMVPQMGICCLFNFLNSGGNKP